jgi:hypothetical protein
VITTIVADPKHHGARIGITSVLRTCGSAETHHPGRRLATDGSRWLSCEPNFLLHVCALSKLFRRLMLTKLAAA